MSGQDSATDGQGENHPDTRMRRMQTSVFHARKASPRGFTLIELMITVAVVAVIAAVAYPAYTNSIRKTRRAEAVSALAALQQAQERWRANNTLYASSPTGLGLQTTSSSGLYTIGVDSADGAGYVVSAQAVAGRSQSADGNCTVLRLQLLAGQVFYGGCAGCSSPTPPATVTDPNRCWTR
jgi:type IV pilus assembly protein PilE